MADLVEPSRQGETVEALVWRVIAGDAEAVEAVMVANPGLAGFGPILPEGTPVIIPEAAAAKPATADLIQLWT